MKRLKKIGVIQTAKVVAVIYALVSAVIFIPFGLIMMATGANNGGMFGGVFVFLLPILYAIVVFVTTALSAIVYNLVTKKIGGIEIELE